MNVKKMFFIVAISHNLLFWFSTAIASGAPIDTPGNSMNPACIACLIAMFLALPVGLFITSATGAFFFAMLLNSVIWTIPALMLYFLLTPETNPQSPDPEQKMPNNLAEQ